MKLFEQFAAVRVVIRFATISSVLLSVLSCHNLRIPACKENADSILTNLTPSVREEIAFTLNKDLRDVTYRDLAGIQMQRFSRVLPQPIDIDCLIYLPGLEHLMFTNLDVTDEHMRHIADLKNLRQLSIYDAKLTLEGVKHISRMKDLEMLALYYSTSAGNEGMKEVAKLKKLRGLVLGEGAVTATGLRELVNLRRLRSLNLCRPQITDLEMTEIAKLSSLEWLEMHEVDATATGFAEFKKLRRLKALNLQFSPISPEIMEQIAGMSNLEKLQVNCQSISDKQLLSIAMNSKLKEVRYHGELLIFEGKTREQLQNAMMTTNSNNILAQLSPKVRGAIGMILGKPDYALSAAEVANVRQLCLMMTDVTDADLKNVALLQSLEIVGLDVTQVTDEALKEIVKLRNLKTINVSASRITQEGVEWFKKQRPDVQVFH